MDPSDDSAEKAVFQSRRPHTVRGWSLFALSFSTLGKFTCLSSFFRPPFIDVSYIGIIYSDIGTSPLYVLNGIWPAAGPAPPKEDVIGGISAIVWSMTLLPLLKYASAQNLRLEGPLLANHRS